MTRPLFTGSALERVRACPASAALPVVRSTSDAAERGTAIHAFLAGVLAVGRDAAIDQVPVEWRAACEAIPLAQLPHVNPDGYIAEVAFAYNVETGQARELGRALSREQAIALYATLGPDEVSCTLDVLALTADGEGVFHADAKTGRRRVTSAARNAQLLLGALAACRAYEKTRAEVAIIYVREDDDPFFDRATLEEWDLDGFAASLRAVAASVRHTRELVAQGLQPDAFEGDWCRYCPSFTACPAKVALIRSIAASPATLREEMTGALHPARAAEVYRRWQVMKAAIDRVGNELYAYAAATPGGIDLGDGVVFGPKRRVVRELDGAVVHKVMTDMHGRDIADRAVKYEATFEGIKDALRKVLQDTPGAKLTHLEAAVVAMVDQAGGLEKVVSAPVKEFRPKKEESAA
jgi:hypothetical protein